MEHKVELDNLRAMYGRLQAQLDETHTALQSEHARRFKAEDEGARLKLEAGRIADLEHHVALLRQERATMERDYQELQKTAIAAPGNALGA